MAETIKSLSDIDRSKCAGFADWLAGQSWKDLPKGPQLLSSQDAMKEKYDDVTNLQVYKEVMCPGVERNTV